MPPTKRDRATVTGLTTISGGAVSLNNNSNNPTNINTGTSDGAVNIATGGTGINAIEIVEKFTLLSKNKLLSQLPTHTIHFGHIINKIKNVNINVNININNNKNNINR